MRRTNAALAAALGLGVVTYALLERTTPSTDDARDRASMVAPGFDVESMVSLAVERGGETLRITVDGHAPDGAPRYRLSGPFDADGDAPALDAALAAVAWANPVRTLGEVTPELRRRTGLDHPRLRLGYQTAAGRGVLVVGGREPTGLGRYVEHDGVVHVVSDVAADAFDVPFSTFRVRSLGLAVDGPLTALRVVGPVTVELAMREGGLQVVSAGGFRASVGRVRALLARLADGPVRSFPGAAEASAASASLRAPWLELTLEAGGARHAVRVGGPCDGGRYAQLDAGAVVCLDAAAVDELALPSLAYVDGRALPAEPGELRSLAIESQGRSLHIESLDDGGFDVTHEGRAVPADPASVEGLLASLRGMRAVAVAPAAPAAQSAVTLRVARRLGLPDVVLRFTVESGLPVAQVDDEPVRLVFPAQLAPRLVPSARSLRAPRLLSDEPAGIVALDLEVAGRTTHVQLEGAEPVVTPPDPSLDDERLRGLVAHLAALEVVRFAEDEESPVASEPPTAVVRWTVQAAPGPVERTLRLYGDAPDGRRARLDGEPMPLVLLPGFWP